MGVRLALGNGTQRSLASDALRNVLGSSLAPIVGPGTGRGWSLTGLLWLGWGQFAVILLLAGCRTLVMPSAIPIRASVVQNAIAQHNLQGQTPMGQTPMGQALRSAIRLPHPSPPLLSQIAQSDRLGGGLGLTELVLLGLGGLSLFGQIAIGRLRRDLARLAQGLPIEGSLSSLQDLRLIQEQLQRQKQELDQAIAAHNEQVDYSEAIAEAKQRADQANRAKSAFLSHMSHELRTPLNAVLGFSQLMRHDPTLSAKNREHLDIVSRSGHHLLGLINDVLELSKIEAGHQEIDLTSVNLSRLGDGLMDLFRLRAEAKGLELRWVRSADLPAYVLLDEQKVRQILINLLENAIKFTSHGYVILRFSIEPLSVSPSAVTSASNYQLCLEVEDSGPGLTTQESQTLFQPFSQTELGRQSHQGSGLGLCISRGFAELLGGSLNLYPALPHGSIVRLSLPASAIAPVESPVTLAIPRHLAPGQAAPQILVVDDRRINRSLICQFLTGVGFIIREASNGQEAIDQWWHHQPDLILMDLEMPILNGESAAAAIRQQQRPGLRPPVIIAVTARGFDLDLAALNPDYFNGLLRKPIETPLLFETLRRHLGIQYHYDDFETPTGHAEERCDRPILNYSNVYYADSSVPSDWLDRLKLATIELDIPRLKTLIAEIEPLHGDLAKTLTEQINNFDFDQILHCVCLAKRSG